MNDVTFASYADNNTIYDYAESIDNVIILLQESAKRIFQCFSDKQIKENTDNYRLIMSTDEQLEMLIGESPVKRRSYKKILRAKINSEGNFFDNVKTIRSKASNILRAEARKNPCMSIEKKTCSKLFV